MHAFPLSCSWASALLVWDGWDDGEKQTKEMEETRVTDPAQSDGGFSCIAGPRLIIRAVQFFDDLGKGQNE
jgi:hypothetical protein